MGHHGTMTARRKNLTIWPGLGLLGCDLVLPENAQPVPDKQEGHVHLEDFAVELPLHTHKGELTGCLMDRKKDGLNWCSIKDAFHLPTSKTSFSQPFILFHGFSQPFQASSSRFAEAPVKPVPSASLKN